MSLADELTFSFLLLKKQVSIFLVVLLFLSDLDLLFVINKSLLGAIAILLELLL